MSEQNVEIIRRVLDEVQERPDALYEILDEQIEWDTAALDMPFPARGRGPEAVRQFFSSWVGAFEDWGFEVQEVIDAGDAVAVRIHQWGKGRTSGVDVENRFWQVWVMREGKAVRATHHSEKAAALEAAGAPE